MLDIPGRVIEIADQLHKAGGECFLVGGYVRDHEFNAESKDIDIEIHGLDMLEVERVLSQSGQVDLVGKAFGVYKIHGLDVDWSLPRIEVSCGEGHRDFHVSVDEHIGIENALRRRDFTMNAMAISLKDGRKVDPFRGDLDIHDRILRYVDRNTFKEDPLRVLRGAQFCSRFGLRATDETVGLCHSMVQTYPSLSRERVWEELKKLLLKGGWAARPSLGIYFLKETCWLGHWPELSILWLVPQDPEYHPEGNVGIHTCEVIDRAAGISDEIPEEDRLVFMLACLLHDVGKAETTVVPKVNRPGHITSHGHDKAGGPIARRFLERLTNEEHIIKRTVALVENHMFPQYCMPAGPSAYRRLQKKVDPYLLLQVARADALPEREEKQYLKMLDAVGKVDLGSSRKTVVQGRHLIARGMKPSPEFGKIIAACEELFLETGERDSNKLLDQILPLY